MFVVIMRAMKLANQKPGWLRYWHIVYPLFILAAFGGPSGSTAEDAAELDSERVADRIAANR